MNDQEPLRIDPVNDIYAIRRPNWDQWKRKKSTRLWKAVALLQNIDPTYLADTFDHDCLSPRVLKREVDFISEVLNIAINSLGTPQLRPLNHTTPIENSEIDLTTFSSWANALGIKLPENFPWQPEMQLDISGWPWGSHSTKLLEKLAEAANLFWKNYDPNDPSTAPTNMRVQTWLAEQGVAVRTAEIMASILRADGLSTGPRK